MKKRMSKILSGLIILTMIISSTGLAFADESGLDAEASKVNSDLIDETQSTDSLNNSGIEQRQTDKTAVPVDTAAKNEFSPKGSSLTVVDYEPMNAPALFYDTSTTDPFLVEQIEPYSVAVIPIVAGTTGIMYINGYAECTNSSATCYMRLGNTKSDVINGTANANLYIKTGEAKYGTTGLAVSKGQTYYVGVVNNYSTGTIDAFVETYVICSASSRTLGQGISKWTLASGKIASGSVSTTYFRVTPDRTGKMTVSLNEFKDTSTGYVTLLDKNKKAVSDKVYFNSALKDYKVYFGVKKGAVYYLKVTNCYGDSLNKTYGIKYSVEAKTDRSLGSKSKAKKLVRKATATSTLFVASTSKSTDWYKIKVTSKRKTVIRINTAAIKSGNLTVAVYKGSKKIATKTISPNYNSVDYTITYGSTYGKANAGTYYIKIVKSTKASGTYSIKYVK